MIGDASGEVGGPEAVSLLSDERRFLLASLVGGSVFVALGIVTLIIQTEVLGRGDSDDMSWAIGVILPVTVAAMLVASRVRCTLHRDRISWNLIVSNREIRLDEIAEIYVDRRIVVAAVGIVETNGRRHRVTAMEPELAHLIVLPRKGGDPT